MNNLDKLINEAMRRSISNFLNENGMFEDGGKKSNSKKNPFRKKKTVQGGTELYDYDDYKRTHQETSKSDADTIRNTIDLDNTDLRQVAMDVYPDHTDNGAQSQLRKVLNGERPMTDDAASKLAQMISRGNVAVK